MRILMITPFLPYPPHSGGQLRIYNILKHLADKHSITLVSHIHCEEERKWVEVLENYCQSVDTVLIKPPPASAWLRSLARLYDILRLRPPTMMILNTPEIKKAISDRIRNSKPDVIHVEFPFAVSSVRDTEEIPKILVEQNIESTICYREYLQKKGRIKRWLAFFEYLVLERFEKKVCKMFDRCITVSEVDKASLLKLVPGLQVDVVPNGVDTTMYKYKAPSGHSKTLVFTGLMNWPANIDAMLYFIKQIYPLIKQDDPNTKLAVVGKNPDPKLCEWASNDIKITGFVEDIQPYIYESAIYIVPLRIGGGTRLKILEAMALGRPVVSTSIGAEGLHVSDNKNILIADSPQTFADSVIRLLADTALAKKLSENARKLVEEEYDWPMIAQKMEWVLQDAIRKKKSIEM